MVAAPDPAAATTWLAVDVGNSRVKFGVFSTAATERLPVCSLFQTSQLEHGIDWQSLRDAVTRNTFRGVIVGSNQQGVNTVLNAWQIELAADAPLVFRDSRQFPIAIDVEQPRRVGLDRLLAAIAANRLRDRHRPSIVVDCGTATTVDFVSVDGAFCGGAILPGFELCAKGLHRYTEVLPLVTIEELVTTDATGEHPALGRNTHAAISSGIFWGQIGAVRELVARQSASIQSAAAPQVFVTGGGGGLLHPYLEHAAFCPYLALQGLVIAAHEQTRDSPAQHDS
ncbi:MAG: type III pantothenate kinase [Planctomycetota bacterium]|jgi:type III pantothenate kinase